MLKVKLTTEKQQKECFFCGTGWFCKHQNSEKYTKLGKTTPKLKGIPLEQAQMYGQYGIESVGLKKRLKNSTQKKLPPKTKIWCFLKW